MLIQGRAVRDLVYSLSRAIAAARREGQQQHVPRLEECRRIALRAFEFQASPCGHDDVAEPAIVQKSYAGERDWIDTSQAAAQAELSRRQVQRIARQLADTGAARRAGGAWVLDRVAFSAHIAERQEQDQ